MIRRACNIIASDFSQQLADQAGVSLFLEWLGLDTLASGQRELRLVVRRVVSQPRTPSLKPTSRTHHLFFFQDACDPSSPPPSCPHPALNPEVAAFSPSFVPSGSAGEELPNWLLFSPSSSEGRSPATGHLVGASPSSSFVDVVRDKGKAPLEDPEPRAPPSVPSSSRGGGGGHGCILLHGGRPSLSTPTTPPPSEVGSKEGEWQTMAQHKQWRRVSHHRPPQHCPVPADLVSRWFNSLRIDHVVVDSSNPVCYLCCHHEGHQARACKRPRSPELPPRLLIDPPPAACNARRPSQFSTLERGTMAQRKQWRRVSCHPPP
jgi:hypothetical protein